MNNVIFIAPPAAGKGTFSEYLVDKYHYTHISTGALFREKLAMKDEEAKELQEIISSGKLVDDERTFKLLKDRLNLLKPEESFILDGVPRSLKQAQKLDIILRDLNLSNYIVVFINASEDVLKKRITGRKICKTCDHSYNVYFDAFKPKQYGICDNCGTELITRPEDSEDAFKVRYDIFIENNKELLDFYRAKNRLFEIENIKEDRTEALKELERIVGAKLD